MVEAKKMAQPGANSWNNQRKITNEKEKTTED